MRMQFESAKDFIRSKARKRAELADYLEEVVLPELAAYGEDKTWGFKRLIPLLRVKPAPAKADVDNFKRVLQHYISVLMWAGLEVQAEDLAAGADLLDEGRVKERVKVLVPQQEGRAKDFLRQVAAVNLPGFEAFYRAYIEAALWSSNTEDGTALDQIDAELEDTTQAAMRRDCQRFYAANQHLMNDPAQGGHDFWLTRNHHGTGFWDRDNLPEDVGEALTQAAHAFGEVNLDYDPERNIIYQM
jgi:hypothetical protein